MRTHIFTVLAALIFTACASYHGREPASAKNSQQEHERTERGVDGAFATSSK